MGVSTASASATGRRAALRGAVESRAGDVCLSGFHLCGGRGESGAGEEDGGGSEELHFGCLVVWLIIGLLFGW